MPSKNKIDNIKVWFSQFVTQHPGKFILVLLTLGFVISFLLSYTIFLSYKNGKWEFEIQKRELKIEELKKGR